LRTRPEASADLILAADAMVYVPDIVPVLTEVSRVLAAGGLLAFTLERHAGDGVVIGEGLRYAHSPHYVRTSLAAAGLTPSQLEEQSFRNENNTPVPGLVVVAAGS
jgi:predicted TPR repeat methyltransferase